MAHKSVLESFLNGYWKIYVMVARRVVRSLVRKNIDVLTARKSNISLESAVAVLMKEELVRGGNNGFVGDVDIPFVYDTQEGIIIGCGSISYVEEYVPKVLTACHEEYNEGVLRVYGNGRHSGVRSAWNMVRWRTTSDFPRIRNVYVMDSRKKHQADGIIVLDERRHGNKVELAKFLQRESPPLFVRVLEATQKAYNKRFG